MLLRQTERARIELLSGACTLGQREQGLLLLCNGDKSFSDLSLMFHGEGERIVLDLVRQGYVEPVVNGSPTASRRKVVPALASAPVRHRTPGRHLS